VRSYAARRAGLDAADDVVAEVFLTAWRRIDDLPDDPLPWLLGVTRRVLAIGGGVSGDEQRCRID